MGNIWRPNKNNKLDHPSTSITRSRIIKKKYFLYHIYIDFYNKIKRSLTQRNRKGTIVELGSGGGFIKEIIPGTITSDILKLPNTDMQLSATKMSFANNSINAFVMIDVFHHISNVEKFLKEANRCLKIQGQIIMIEPSCTFFGKLIYKNFHHEPFDQNTTWSFKSKGPLSSSNSALPWIVFYRDKKIFEKKFPDLIITNIRTHTPFKFIISGGFGYPQLLPDFFYPLIIRIEHILKPYNNMLGMFYIITIQKKK